MVRNETLCVNKADFSDIAIVRHDPGPLRDGHVRVTVGPWALTANNITYMVTGNQIGYWKYFTPEAYGIDQPGFGRMPVWGFAEVTESRCADVSVGTVIYGFFPITQSFDMQPVRITKSGFMDGADHRNQLHDIYNNYTFVSADPSFALHRDLQPLLRPLFTTSFLIDDFLDEKKVFGAERVLFLSASSKTALGAAYCLKARDGISVAGLTSASNIDFVTATDFYDSVQGYETLSDMDASVPTVIVDMSGNGQVLAQCAAHLGDALKYVCRVGLSHWDADKVTSPNDGPPSAIFFAPDRAKKRIAEWGGSGFAAKLAGHWVPFLQSAEAWLSVETATGIEAVLPVYKATLEGQASPDTGYLFSI